RNGDLLLPDVTHALQDRQVNFGDADSEILQVELRRDIRPQLAKERDQRVAGDESGGATRMQRRMLGALHREVREAGAADRLDYQTLEVEEVELTGRGVQANRFPLPGQHDAAELDLVR